MTNAAGERLFISEELPERPGGTPRKRGSKSEPPSLRVGEPDPDSPFPHVHQREGNGAGPRVERWRRTVWESRSIKRSWQPTQSSSRARWSDMPEPLAHDDAARRAVIDWMARAQGGETVATPVDLSDTTRHANERWPRRLPSVADRPAREAAAAQVPITVSAIEKDAAEPGLVTVRLTVAGRDAVVIVDVREGPGREPRFRFAEGLHPWQATSAESDAMLRALVLAAAP